MRRHGKASLLRHLHHLQGAVDAAEIAHIRLHHVDRAHLDREAPQRQVAILLAARDVEVERVCHLLGPVIFPIGARLLEMADAVILQHAADLDRLFRRVTAIGIHQQAGIGAEGLADERHDLVGPARPFILVMTAFLADAELEGGIAMLVPQAREAHGLLLGRDLAALHAGGIDRKRPRPAAQQFADALARALAAQVPKRGIEPGQGPHQVGAREFVLPLRDHVGQSGDIVSIGAQGPARHLAVKDLAGDVGIVVRDLSPALQSILGRDPDEADERRAEGLQAFDLHGAAPGDAVRTRLD